MSIEFERLSYDINMLRHEDVFAEWWYFDAQDEVNGYGVYLVYYGCLGESPPSVSFSVFSPEFGESSFHQQPNESRFDLQGITIGENEIIPYNNQEIRVIARGKDFEADLLLTSSHNPSLVSFFEDSMMWLINSPKADVYGKLSIFGTEIQFVGSGYHDHNWFYADSFVSEFTNNREVLVNLLKGWHFGRIASENVVVVYGHNKDETALIVFEDKSVEVIEDNVSIEKLQWQVSSRLGFMYPTVYEISGTSKTGRPMRIHFETKHILAEKRLLTVEDIVTSGYVRGINQGLINLGNRQMWGSGIYEVWI